MKWFWNILGIVLILVGVAWFLQGINILPGSFMTGNPLYAVLGVILGAIGSSLIVFSNRRSKAAVTEDRTRMDQ